MRKVLLTRPTYERPDFSLRTRTRDAQDGPPSPSPKGRGEVGEVVRPADLNLQNILDLAASLPDKDRQELLDRLALQHQQQTPAADRDVEMWSGAVYDALQRTLGDSAGALGGPLPARRLLGAQSAWRPVRQFMQSSKLSELAVRERQSVYAMLAGLLVKHARSVAGRTGAPLSAKLVSNCTGNIGWVFEDSFPGYLASGLAPVVARRLTQPR